METPTYFKDEDVHFPHSGEPAPPPTTVEGVQMSASFTPQHGSCVRFRGLNTQATVLTLFGDDVNEIAHIVLAGNRALS